MDWDPVAMETEAQQNHARVQDLRAAHGSVMALRPPIWFGTAYERSRFDMRLMMQRWESLVDVLDRQAEVVGQAAGQLRGLQGDMGALQASALVQEFRIQRSGWVQSMRDGITTLGPVHNWNRGKIVAAVIAIEFRLTGLDGMLAARLGGLVIQDVADGVQQGAIDLTNRASAIPGDLLSGANNWMVDWAEDNWPGAAGGLRAWQGGSEEFLGHLTRQPRWLQEMLYSGRMPHVAELLGGGLYTAGAAIGTVAPGDVFSDGTALVPHLRGTNHEAYQVDDMGGVMQRMQDVYSTHANHDRPAVEVTVVERDGQPPRFLVTIPGTTTGLGPEGWVGSAHGTDWPANLKAVGYGDSHVTQSTKAAIDMAIRDYERSHGVTLERPNVALTGHSQGGIIAGNIASDPQFTARYQVDAVMTAGSPINTIPIDPSVPVVNFSNPADVVPKLDLGGVPVAGSPQPQSNVIEYALPNWTDPITSHRQQPYTDYITQVQGDARLDGMNEAMSGYYGGRQTTWTYEIGRTP